MSLLKKRSHIDSLIFIFLFIPLCIAYYIGCSTYFENIHGISNYFNEHDHEHYLSTMKHIEEGNIILSINNNLGISLIYMNIIKVFSWFGIVKVELIAFIVNMITLVFVFSFYNKACERLGLIGGTRFYFFLGLQFLYFSQLINKDLLTVLYILICLNLLFDKRFKTIFFLTLIFFFVRIQLLIFGVLCIYLSFGNFKKRILISYIVTSFVAAFMSVKGDMLSSETLGSGFSSFVVTFNQQFYYLGYLIFNPLRIIQFLIDVYLSFFIYTDGLIDIAKTLRLPLIISMTLLIRPILFSFRNFRKINTTELKNVNIIIVSFVLTWLMNPTINARYVMLLIPFMIILGRFVLINKYKIN